MIVKTKYINRKTVQMKMIILFYFFKFFFMVRSNTVLQYLNIISMSKLKDDGRNNSLVAIILVSQRLEKNIFCKILTKITLVYIGPSQDF